MHHAQKTKHDLLVTKGTTLPILDKEIIAERQANQHGEHSSNP
jgi:hypothetical protein